MSIDLNKAFDQVEVILNYDYSHRWKENPNRDKPSRTILSLDRTLGSVIKLLTPSTAYTDAFNAFLEAIPNDVKSLIFMIKRFYQKSWGNDWRKHFTVDYIDGKPGHELKFDNRTIRSGYLRVGYAPDGSWRIFKLRVDFMPCEKSTWKMTSQRQFSCRAASSSTSIPITQTKVSSSQPIVNIASSSAPMMP